jgi:hypothetical protein
MVRPLPAELSDPRRLPASHVSEEQHASDNLDKTATCQAVKNGGQTFHGITLRMSHNICKAELKDYPRAHASRNCNPDKCQK